ncbi:NAD(P)-dependent oxidoreductase [Streptomyces atratus]|uniref:NAD(P)-dependent oxidoreductase n=1 Tax=Streptomyces atratus TaxID=1893 RepID=UPI0036619279
MRAAAIPAKVIGSRVLREALDRGHQVTAAVRDTKKLTEQHPEPHGHHRRRPRPRLGDGRSQGQDVVVSAVGGGDGPGHIATIAPAAKSLVAGPRPLGTKAPQLIAAGGAGSLRTPDGKQVWDAEGLPEFLLQIMHAHGDALDFYRSVDDVR